jgi:hypothetical protein
MTRNTSRAQCAHTADPCNKVPAIPISEISAAPAACAFALMGHSSTGQGKRIMPLSAASGRTCAGHGAVNDVDWPGIHSVSAAPRMFDTDSGAFAEPATAEKLARCDWKLVSTGRDGCPKSGLQTGLVARPQPIT